ncbi:hypothetical protein [Desulfosporosinus sp. BG]|uniref:hypothetical protein n=1 Tax=Desulfosporosinus sp. BG TaxID=1633135 RepID=UPI00083A913B|nr:hypothetical protein [Desulfosporosinus sp. BG]ODA42973.1 hypothetical protein DSBG_0323 [Desulfosporosinus sp. BG]
MLVVQTQLEIINEQIMLKDKLRHELEQVQTLLSFNQDISADSQRACHYKRDILFIIVYTAKSL